MTKVQVATKDYTALRTSIRQEIQDAALIGSGAVHARYIEAGNPLTDSAWKSMPEYANAIDMNTSGIAQAIDRALKGGYLEYDPRDCFIGKASKAQRGNTYATKSECTDIRFSDGDGPGSPDLAAELIDRLPVLASRAVPAGLEQFMGAPTEQELQELYQIEQDLSQDDWLLPIGSALLMVRRANALIDSERFVNHKNIRRGIYDRLTRELDDALKAVQRIRKALNAFTIEEN